MFSFVGDWVLDPFVGTGTTVEASMLAGRNGIGVDVEPQYLDMASKRIRQVFSEVIHPPKRLLERVPAYAVP